MKTMEEIETMLEGLVEYYDSDDFKDNYAHVLIEDTQNHGAERLVENSRRWDIIENRPFPLSLADAERIVEYVTDNYDEFVRDMVNYWVGYDSIGGVEFGEQEEEKPEGFIEEEYNGDFSVSGDYLYYNLGGSGIHFKVTQDDAYRILDELDAEE